MIIDSVSFGPTKPGEEIDDLVRGKHPLWSLPVKEALFIDYGGEPLVWVTENSTSGTWLAFDAGKPAIRTDEGFPFTEEQHIYYLEFSSPLSAIEAVPKDGIPVLSTFDLSTRRMRFVWSWTMFGIGRSGNSTLVIETLSTDELPDFDRVRKYLLSLAPHDETDADHS